MNKKGFFAIGIYNPKTTDNMGTLWRSAHLYGASYIFTIGYRYQQQPTDTTKSTRHVPLFDYKDWKDFQKNLPQDVQVVLIEESTRHQLSNFVHPKSAVYVLGSEDGGIPEKYFKNNLVVNIPTNNIAC